jgi:hypothetical protein
MLVRWGTWNDFDLQNPRPHLKLEHDEEVLDDTQTELLVPRLVVPKPLNRSCHVT